MRISKKKTEELHLAIEQPITFFHELMEEGIFKDMSEDKLILLEAHLAMMKNRILNRVKLALNIEGIY